MSVGDSDTENARGWIFSFKDGSNQFEGRSDETNKGITEPISIPYARL